MMAALAGFFALGFYAVTVTALIRTWRLIGRSPLVVLQQGRADEIVAVAAHAVFPLVLVLSTLRPDLGWFRPLLDAPAMRLFSGALLLGGLGWQYISMTALGEALRIGIDPAQRTHLVRHGPYRYVRHPIYTAFLGYYLGAWLLQPNLLFSILAPLAAARIVLQALREERMLAGTFGDAYRGYMASTKRFLPGIL